MVCCVSVCDWLEVALHLVWGSVRKRKASGETVMTQVVAPQHTNYLGNIFGGTIMAWVDTAAAICAVRYANLTVVTAAVDALQFRQPIKLGWIVTIRAKVNFVSRTSCEVGVKVMGEDPKSGVTHHAASAYMTMVALDSDGKPTPMPELIVQSATEKRREAEASIRRRLRMKLRDSLG